MVTVGEFSRPARERTRALAALLASAGMKAQAVENLVEERWKKLVWNIPVQQIPLDSRGA